MNTQKESHTYTVLEYSYRDASGYSVYSSILLVGPHTDADKDLIISRLDSHQFFVPERVGIPPLQSGLYEYSGGYPTEDDHPWHEFLDLRTATPEEIGSLVLYGDTKDLIAKFSAISDWESWRYDWDYMRFGK